MIWVKRIALAIVSTLLTLLLLEVGLRVLNVGPTRWAHPWHLESDDKRHGVDVYPDDPRGYFEVDIRDEAVAHQLVQDGVPEVRERAEATPYGVLFRYSEELCRGPDIPPKSGPRIVAIGDSFTEGQGVREDDTWAEQLEALMGQEVINCGRRGHDFPDIHEFFERQLPLAPDVVVYAMTLNDAQQSEAFHDEQDFLNDWILDRRRMFQDAPKHRPFWSSRIWAFVEERAEARRVGEETTRWYNAMYDEPNGEGWAATIDHVAAMHETMQERGGRFLVAMWPLFVSLEGEYPFAEVHARIADAFRERGVAVVDTLEVFRGEQSAELWVHPADRHPNERAHAMFAQQVHAALEGE